MLLCAAPVFGGSSSIAYETWRALVPGSGVVLALDQGSWNLRYQSILGLETPRIGTGVHRPVRYQTIDVGYAFGGLTAYVGSFDLFWHSVHYDDLSSGVRGLMAGLRGEVATFSRVSLVEDVGTFICNPTRKLDRCDKLAAAAGERQRDRHRGGAARCADSNASRNSSVANTTIVHGVLAVQRRPSA